jgi:hypothetical protein
MRLMHVCWVTPCLWLCLLVSVFQFALCVSSQLSSVPGCRHWYVLFSCLMVRVCVFTGSDGELIGPMPIPDPVTDLVIVVLHVTVTDMLASSPCAAKHECLLGEACTS